MVRDAASWVLEVGRVVAFGDVRRDVRKPEDAFGGGASALDLVDDVRDLGQRRDEPLGHEDERDERPDGQLTREPQRRADEQPVAADEEGRGKGEPGEQFHPRPVEVAELQDAHRRLEDVVGGVGDAVAFVGLAVGRLRQFDAVDAVLDAGVEAGDGRLPLAVARRDGAHEPPRQPRDGGDGDERHQGELGVEREEDERDAADHDHEPQRVHQRVVEKGLQITGVVVEDGHDFAGLFVVEEGHIEREQFLEAVGADGVHHLVGELVGGDAVDPGKDARGDERASDERDRQPELRFGPRGNQ